MPITAGFTYSCSSAAVGGISSIGIANTSDITAVTYASGVVSAITYAASKGFYSITFEDDGCTFTETIEVVNNKVFYKPEYKFKIGHRTAAAKLFIDALNGCERFMVSHVERATPSLRWISGFTSTQGLRITAGSSTTGGAVNEQNMVEITIGHPTGVQYPCSTFTATYTTI